VFDLSALAWFTVPYGNQAETFTTGTSSVYYEDDIYIRKDGTGRIFALSLTANVLQPFTVDILPQGAATVGDKMFVGFIEETNRMSYLYTLGNTRSELSRWIII
jgi:hypothetical protein